ncbi:MAG: Trk system potassium transporter TrkA [Proteobacteria bacterium]|nr:Trk system potassium transporter TrkA [Pseudomonadota bacterium]
MIFKKAKSAENILILGLGGVGLYLAKRLVHEGYAVTVIEQDSKKIRHADGIIDARILKGDAMSIDCWKEAKVRNIDYLIAVTDNDAVNILSSMIGDRFGIPRKIARVRSLELCTGTSVLNMEDLKIDLIIHPEELAAQEIVRLVKRTAGNEIIDISEGQMQVMATRIHETSPLANKKLMEISREYKDLFFRVLAIARGTTTIIPRGNNQIKPNDQILIMANREALTQLMELTGVKQHNRHRVMILGGGLIGARVAELLGKSVRVKLIERNDFDAKELSFALEHTEVLHGDGSDAEVLDTAGLADMDTFITATQDDETNVMSSLLAKNLINNKNPDSQAKTIAMVNKEEYLVLSSTIGLDIALNKKILAGNEIIKYIRRGELLSVAHLHGFDMDIVELQVAKGSQICKTPLNKLDASFDGKILIGTIYRNGKWEIAVGDTHLQEGDRAIAVCGSMMFKDLQELFLEK